MLLILILSFNMNHRLVMNKEKQYVNDQTRSQEKFFWGGGIKWRGGRGRSPEDFERFLTILREIGHLTVALIARKIILYMLILFNRKKI